jgi:AMMECR1 domain-containing protein
VAPGGLPAAPFVTVYAGGVLRGCFGCAEGPPRDRLSRAFLRALEDSRYGLVRAEERGHLTMVVSYATGPHVVDPERVGDQVEAGVEGLGVIKDGRTRAMLLPHVTRDLRAGPRDLLAHLGRKAGLADWSDATVFAFRTEDVIVRSGVRRRSVREGDSGARAAAWLARLVAPDGTITFAVDPRRRERFPTGIMHHGRAAVVVRALEGHAAHARTVARARTWLRRAIERALRGDPLEGWPADPAMQAGTLALAQLAGIDCGMELAERARTEAVLASAWHGAQVVTALGVAAPDALWRSCIRDLSQRPWAPWTVLAARARRDAATVREASRALVASLRSSPPNEGGCGTTDVPETALTALVVEALDGLDDAEARDAVRRGRRFLTRLQLLGEDVPAPLDPHLADGAFPASPIVDVLRCDVVAHALLALGRPS